MGYAVKGTYSTIDRLMKVPEVTHEVLGTVLEHGLSEIQETAAGLVAVDTGQGRDTLLQPEAISVDHKRLVGRFGLITPELKKRAWYLSFIEWGTKGYKKGERRIAGRTKPGNPRLRAGEIVSRGGTLKLRKVSRDIPARAARPFMKPALDLNRARLLELHTMGIKQAVNIAWKRTKGALLGSLVR